MKYSKLFEPFELPGKLKLRNRLVMAPMTTTSGNIDSTFSDEEISYLTERAADGIGLVMSPACYVHKTGHSFERQVGCHNDEMLPRLHRLADAINRHGAASFLQLYHGGNAAKSAMVGGPTLSSSAVKNRAGNSEMPQAMTLADLHMVQEAFATAADRAKRAGFTGVEIHGANTYLLQQFFSPFTNKRQDDYGCQNMENRTRFARETVAQIRQAVGAEYPISYRVSPEEADPDGYSTADTVELLKIVSEAGVDLMHISAREYGTSLRKDLAEGSNPTGYIKEALGAGIPVIAVGGIITPVRASEVLREGLDLVALGRGLLLNANWVQKVESGQEEKLVSTITSERELEALEIPPRMKGYIKKWYLPD